MEEARKAAMEASVSVEAGMTTATALVRLNQAVVKVQDYIDNKFARTSSHISSLSGSARFNAAGRQAGKAAADAMPIGRRGIAGTTKRLTSGS